MNYPPAKASGISQPVKLNFIGYRIFRKYTLIRKSSVIICKRKIKLYLYKKELDNLYKSLISWSGHLKWANTYNLRRYIINYINQETIKYENRIYSNNITRNLTE